MYYVNIDVAAYFDNLLGIGMVSFHVILNFCIWKLDIQTLPYELLGGVLYSTENNSLSIWEEIKKNLKLYLSKRIDHPF